MMKLLAGLILLTALSLLGGCANPTADLCAGWRPIRPDPSDISVVSGDLARQIAAHNRFGEAACRWTP